MNDEVKRISTELAATIAERLASEEVKALIDSTKAASDEDTGTFEVVITTENLDRYQEVIKLDAWDDERYLANPVVLWGHDHNLIIGMTTALEVRDGKKIARGKFAPTEFAQEKRRLYDLGFLRATSVGFLEKEREGNLITKAELLEFSFVSVPANPYALSLAMEKGLSVNELVTKGIMFVEKEAEPTIPESEEGDIPPGPPEEEPGPTADERSFTTKQLSPVISSLRAALVALEALGTTEEPEGDEAPEGETEEERDLREFNEKRRLLQDASTVVGEVLAEARRSLQARGL